MILILHILSSILLFFIINIIGKYAPTDFKYYQISTFSQTDEAPAFNFLFRILTPVVFIILLSSALYYFGQDYLVKDIYYISIYYVLFRAVFSIITSRTYLVNWKKQFLYAISTILITYLVYDKLISKRENLLPDFSNIANELWIIILLFLYSLLNKIDSRSDSAEKRKLLYIKKNLTSLEKKYSLTIDAQVQSKRLKHIIYAIIIHENFNRPKIFRLAENLKRYISKEELTLGIMQVKSNKNISDKESIEMGIDKLLIEFKNLKINFQAEYLKLDENNRTNSYLDRQYQFALIRSHNHCDDYSYEVLLLADYINEKFYGDIDKNEKLFEFQII
ncbi:hypothetical protein [uncultured Flavobacterium sp.]|uniref:hypothetical protein n=1 Tax=uncultured Flavobacterium sp. TaxID=165435 RepID=UPI0026003AD8|nr:hypothetical protein [uncultured Flavobacterium sp.]